MKVNIYAVGKIKDKPLAELIDNYIKRISCYCQIKVVEVKDMPTDGNEGLVLKNEGEQLMNRVGVGFTIALCIEGKQMTSLDFARCLEKAFVIGQATVNIIIGGSLGLSEQVKKRADLLISLSSMTFLHNHARLIILEQIYRAFKINANQKYHK